MDIAALCRSTSAAHGDRARCGYEPVAAEGQRLQEQIAETARAYIDACVAGRPTVILAENVHWFDDATRALLTTLAQDGPHGVLLIGTSRESEDGPWEAIELKPLTQAGRLELIDALRDGLAGQDRLALAARSGGIPLYLEELVRAGPTTSIAAIRFQSRLGQRRLQAARGAAVRDPEASSRRHGCPRAGGRPLAA